MKQSMLELINRLTTLIGQTLEPAPHKESTSYVVALNTGLAALAPLKAGQLLGFSMKLLNLPAHGAHLLSTLRAILRQVVGHDPFRAVGGHLSSEQCHPDVSWKTSYLDGFAMRQFAVAPLQLLDTPVGSFSLAVVHQPVGFEWAVEALTHLCNLQHHLFGSVPRVHQHRFEGELAMLCHQEHLIDMVHLAFA